MCSAGYFNKIIDEKYECVECPEQCLYCSEDSIQSNLCIKCNNKKSYYEKYTNSNDNGDNYISCINENNIPANYHLNIDKLRYEPCYNTCNECFNYGDNINNNCTNCISGYIIREEYPNNCVEECNYYYYYNKFNQYKCTVTEECPEEKKFLLKNKGKCVENCLSNSPYIFQYKNECVDECPLGTRPNSNNICINENVGNECSIVEKNLYINYLDLIDEKKKNVINFVKEYTFEHEGRNSEIYLYKNEKYNFIIFKDENCINNYIDQKIITIPKMYFGNCYNDLKNNYSLTNEDNIITVLIDIPRQNQSSFTYYNFYNPENGNTLDL